MKLYTIKKGKFYSKGDRVQPAIFQTGLTLLCIVLAFTYNLWFGLGALASFFIFKMFIDSEIAMTCMRVYFFKNCVYRLPNNYDQVNKLFGFSEGYHHWNSARFGWRCTDGEKIELIAYCYVDGVRIEKPMLKCKPETWVFCNIQKKYSKYVFKALIANNQSTTVSVNTNEKWSVYSFFKLFIYRLYPYFGGKISAPQDMGLYMIKLHMS